MRGSIDRRFDRSKRTYRSRDFSILLRGTVNGKNRIFFIRWKRSKNACFLPFRLLNERKVDENVFFRSLGQPACRIRPSVTFNSRTEKISLRSVRKRIHVHHCTFLHKERSIGQKRIT
jgi:hypothetical protein